MYRVGEGYDVHKLVEGRDLILGGVKIPFEKGLLGHSDADVLLHAIMDALLGAMALGDIGKHFPDTDEKYKGVSSIELLKEVKSIIKDNCEKKGKAFEICNIDATIICQLPKLRPYIDNMRENIAASLEIDIDRVSVKATTEEGLGFTGRGEGIAAKAISLVEVDK
ncbi:MAG: 2-C-methyl-D-erythritol 2,4-cyclodiphosphate synthase [Lachnospiraceae bacterium]|nr:2-C-methyl-D-erythritol 2,4-cyclodiphosphate synthase [Lachnospiraceae bacterium]